jgi:hypothetical protein
VRAATEKDSERIITIVDVTKRNRSTNPRAAQSCASTGSENCLAVMEQSVDTAV